MFNNKNKCVITPWLRFLILLILLLSYIGTRSIVHTSNNVKEKSGGNTTVPLIEKVKDMNINESTKSFPEDNVEKITISEATDSLLKNMGTCKGYKPTNESNLFLKSLDFDNVNRFVMFFGFARSGHSWIGSLLDASPNALIGNQVGALGMYNKKINKTEAFSKLATASFFCGKYGRLQVYNYTIPGLWQGKVRDKLEVIGDKMGGVSAEMLLHRGSNPWENERDARAQKKYFDGFLRYLKVEPRIIVVLRNPFDMIATNVLRLIEKEKRQRQKRQRHPMNEERQRHPRNNVLGRILREYKEVMWAVKNLGDPRQWHVMTMENFATNTEKELLSLCKFTGVDCPPDMIAKVVEKTHHEVHHTKHMIQWKSSEEKVVSDYIKENLSLYYDNDGIHKSMNM